MGDFMGIGQLNLKQVTAIEVTNLRKRFRRASGEIVAAVDIDGLDVYAGEFLVLLGPSGCGKTTLLRCIAGLETPDEGDIYFGKRHVFSMDQSLNTPVEERGLSMVFQSYALWPHMTALENVMYPLKHGKLLKRSERLSRSGMRSAAEASLELVDIAAIANQYPAQMSGGQQQRVALARALVDNRDIILFDEPLSNVDARVREMLRFELDSMHTKIGFTAVYVTHDQVEAMDLATRIVVMDRGRVAQIGTPEQIYQRPVTRYVAEFVGGTNYFAVLINSDTLTVTVDNAFVKLPLDETVASEVVAAGRTELLVRPEDVIVQQDDGSGLSGKLVSGSLIGAFWDGIISTGVGPIRVRSMTNWDGHVGQRVGFLLRPKVMQFFTPADEL